MAILIRRLPVVENPRYEKVSFVVAIGNVEPDGGLQTSVGDASQLSVVVTV